MRTRTLLAIIVVVIVVSATALFFLAGSNDTSHTAIQSAPPGDPCIPNSPDPARACDPNELNQTTPGQNWTLSGVGYSTIVLNFVDGSHMTVTQASAIAFAIVSYSGSPITNVSYTADVKFGGTGDLSGLVVSNVVTKVYVTPLSTSVQPVMSAPGTIGAGTSIPLGQRVNVASFVLNGTVLQNAVAARADGSYKLEFFTTFLWTPVFTTLHQVPSARNASFSAEVPITLSTTTPPPGPTPIPTPPPNPTPPSPPHPRLCFAVAGTTPCIT